MEKNENVMEKNMLHQYDLRRFVDALKKKDHIDCIFQPMWATRISTAGVCSGTRKPNRKYAHVSGINFAQELRDIKQRIPESLKEKTKYVPNLRLRLSTRENYSRLDNTGIRKRFAKELFRLNSIVSTDLFVLPGLFPLNGKSAPRYRQLLEDFQEISKKEHPKARIGFEIAPADYKYIPMLSPGCNSIVISSSVNSDSGKANLKRAISEARSNDLEPYCANALIFIGPESFASTLIREPVKGFSFYHGGPPWKEDKRYFNPVGTIVHSDGDKNRYWTEEEMIEEHSEDTQLSTLCPCQECSGYTVKEWFSRKGNRVSQSNLKHKALLLRAQSEDQFNNHLQEIARIDKLLRKDLSVAKVPVRIRTSNGKPASAPTTISIPHSADTLEKKITYVAKNGSKESVDVSFIQNCLPKISSEELGKTLPELLRSGEIKFGIRSSDGRLFFTA